MNAFAPPGTGHRLTPFLLLAPVLAAALMVWLTTKPFRVLVATGMMFSANDEVRAEEGWRYHRICFAAENEANVDLAAERFVEGEDGEMVPDGFESWGGEDGHCCNKKHYVVVPKRKRRLVMKCQGKIVEE